MKSLHPAAPVTVETMEQLLNDFAKVAKHERLAKEREGHRPAPARPSFNSAKLIRVNTK